jgi:hypothetical protein
MAHSISSAFTKNKTDNLYTPKILVDPIIPYLKEKVQYYRQVKYREPIIWCPFDLESSEFVIMCKENGFKCEFSHIDRGQDFFEYEPKHWDIAISNPPFSRKLDVFKRLNSFRNPWAMIMNVMAFNYEEINRYFADNLVEVMFFDRRISFNGNPSSFGSCYVCNDFLNRDIRFEKLPHNNAGKNYTPSRMYGTTN